MTISLPLTIAGSLKSLPQGQGSGLTGTAPGVQGGGQSFSSIQQSVPDQGGQRSQLIAALRQLFPALSEQGGKDLPASLTLDQLIGLIQKSGVKLDKSSLTMLQSQDNKTGDQGLSPELMALLQALVNSGVPQSSDPKSGGGGQAQVSATGQQGQVSTSQASSESLSQLLNSLTHGAQDTSKVQQDPTQLPQQLSTANATQLQEAVYLRQVLTQILKYPQSDTQNSQIFVQGDTTATDGNIGAADIISKLFGTSTTPERLASLEKELAGAGLRGVQSTSSSAAPGSGASSNNPTQFISALLSQPGTPAPASAVPQPMSVSVPMGQPGWDQALSQNVLWMAKHDVQVASIRLNPPQLGPLEVRITFNHDQANVNFISHHGVVREAVEAALPKLRDMFGQGGVNLVNVDVSDDSSMGRQAGGADGGSGGGSPDQGLGGAEVSLPLSETPSMTMSTLPTGLVDYFA